MYSLAEATQRRPIVNELFKLSLPDTTSILGHSCHTAVHSHLQLHFAAVELRVFEFIISAAQSIQIIYICLLQVG